MSNTKPGQRKVPKLADLHADINTAFKTDELNLLLNQPPHETWLKQHPTASVKNSKGENVKARYLPIDKVEFLLTYIFGQWRVEILDTKLILNACCATIRLHYLNPVTLEWSFHDGCGAKSVQLDAQSRPSDLTAIKSEAVMMALPSAVSYAIKDAAEHLGALFGRDLNRRDVIEFAGAYGDGRPPEDNLQTNNISHQQPAVQQPQAPVPVWNGTAWVIPEPGAVVTQPGNDQQPGKINLPF